MRLWAPLPEAKEDGGGDDKSREGECVAHCVDDVKGQQLVLRGALCAHRDTVYMGHLTSPPTSSPTSFFPMKRGRSGAPSPAPPGT